MLALPPKAKLPNATSMPNIQHNKKMGKPPSEAQKKSTTLGIKFSLDCRQICHAFRKKKPPLLRLG